MSAPSARRPRSLPPAALASALLLAACAQLRAGGGPAAQPAASPVAAAAAAPGPVPDVDAMAEATRTVEPQPYVSARAYRHLLSALLARQEEDFATTAAELREALLYDPESAHLHTLLADALVRQGRVADAEEEIRAALSHEPQHAPALVLLGRIAAARDLAGEARAAWRSAIGALPLDPDAYRELVRLEAAQGNPAAAALVAQELEAVAQQALREAIAEDRAEGVLEAGLSVGPGGQIIESDGAAGVRAQRLRESGAEAWAEVGRAFAQKHDDAGADESFARASALDALDPDVIASHAQYLESRRRFVEARAAELKLLSQRPDAPEVLATLTRLALEEGDAETAAAHVHKLVGLAADLASEPDFNPELPPPRAPRAAQVGEGAAAREPHDPEGEGRRDLAAALLRAGVPMLSARRSSEALSAFEAALRLFPAHPELSFYRALALERRGRAREAVQLFEQIAAPREAWPQLSFLGVERPALVLDARVQAALARGKIGDAGEAARKLRAIFESHPLDEGVALGLLEAYERAGRASEAVTLLASAVREHPRSEALLYALGSAEDRAGLKVEALRTQRELLAIAPENSGALNYVGYALAEAGGAAELAEAEKLLSRAVELRPDDGAIADSYGFCLLRRGDARRALPELRRADRLNPGDPVILSHLGDAQLASGLRDDAAATFRRALQKLGSAAVAPAVRAPRRHASAAASAAADRAAEAQAEARAEVLDEERDPDPGDARVRAELEQKLRSLTAR